MAIGLIIPKALAIQLTSARHRGFSGLHYISTSMNMISGLLGGKKAG